MMPPAAAATTPSPAHSTATDPARVAELDGLRGLAVAMVLFNHLALQVAAVPSTLTWYSAAHRWCDQGVDFFFVLSGYLIGGILLRLPRSPHGLRSFYVRRAFRILPAYWLLLASFVVVSVVDHALRFGLIRYYSFAHPFWHYLLFVQNNTMAITRDWGTDWLAVTWSLAVEEQFYLLAPWIVGRVNRPAVIVLCVVGIIGSIAARWYAVAGAHNLLAAYVLLPCRSDGLCLGVLVAVAMQSRSGAERLRRSGRALVAVSAAAAVAVILVWPRLNVPAAEALQRTLHVIVATGLLVGAVLHRDSIIAVAVRWRPWVLLGGISYFVYLFHMPVSFVVRTAAHDLDPLAAAALTVGITLLAALASRRWVELPLLRVGRRLAEAQGLSVPGPR